MTLSEWIDREMVGSRHAFIRAMAKRLAEAGTPVSAHTIAACDRGMKLTKHPLAKALSDLTRGCVTVKELCE